MTSELIQRLTQRGITVAVAESLTGGLLAARLTEVPWSFVAALLPTRLISNMSC